MLEWGAPTVSASKLGEAFLPGKHKVPDINPVGAASRFTTWITTCTSGVLESWQSVGSLNRLFFNPFPCC